jgi:hypothetical protein
MTGAPPQEARARLATLLGAACRREQIVVISLALPIALAATTLTWRFVGAAPAVVAAAVSLIACAAVAWRRTRAYDGVWLLRRLNAALPALEDSADLVVEPPTTNRSLRVDDTRGGATTAPARTRLERLQRDRISQRLASSPMPDLRRAWPGRTLAVVWITALLVGALGVVAPGVFSRLRTSEGAAPALATATTIREVALTIDAPAYTGVSTQRIGSLDGSAPADSRVAWTIRFDREPSQASLVFHDGSELRLRRDGDAWRGERVLDASVLYRVAVDGAPPVAPAKLHRLDAVPDHAPELIVRAPEKTLSLHTKDQKTWKLAFEASDDYGLGPAELSIALAQGSGEQIEVTEQKVALEGGRDPHRRSYERKLDLAALGYSEGDDLIVRLSVADNRVPEANVASTASLILRWPPEATGATAGMEGLVQRAMPAYFRSQRQIIIDTEALIAERAGLAEKTFERRSDELGVDQKILRVRYGQFLGEEFEGGAEHAPPEAKAAAGAGSSAREDGPSDSLKLLPGHHEEEEAGDAPMGFGQESRASRGIGREGDVLSEFGHVHDPEEAATLFDPQTKEILRAALNEMWQAELHLRQAEPDRALPYEYKALDYIKQVQQAQRIYLQRVGLDLPQLDETRRLSGDRAGLSDRGPPPPGAEEHDSTIATQWSALAGDARPDLVALEGWVRARQESVPDALGVLAAIDALRRDPQCEHCREELQARLWPLLPAPAAGVVPRATPDAAGAAWLDALTGKAP